MSIKQPNHAQAPHCLLLGYARCNPALKKHASAPHQAAGFRSRQQVQLRRQVRHLPPPLPALLRAVVRHEVDAPRQACARHRSSETPSRTGCLQSYEGCKHSIPEAPRSWLLRFLHVLAVTSKRRMKATNMLAKARAPAPSSAGDSPAYSACQPSSRTIVRSASRVPRYSGSTPCMPSWTAPAKRHSLSCCKSCRAARAPNRTVACVQDYAAGTDVGTKAHLASES